MNAPIDSKVKIFAPMEEVLKYLVFDENIEWCDFYRFNIPYIFHGEFEKYDFGLIKKWDVERFMDVTGGDEYSWVTIDQDQYNDNITVLEYYVGWGLCRGILKKLSGITGWKIENKYEPPNNFCSGKYICNHGRIELDEINVFSFTAIT